jgi:hypothetical protein
MLSSTPTHDSIQPEMAASGDSLRRRPPTAMLVDEGRIQELKNTPSGTYDLRKLVRLCEELNVCYSNESYFAVAMLARAVLDHVPPLFGLRTFAEVVSSYAWGRSRRDAMDHVENSTRKVADLHLHSVATRHELLPNQAQVNFGPTLDVLLGEIVKLLNTGSTASGGAVNP